LSYKKKTRDSYSTSSRQENAKAVLPYIGGFMVALFIWLGWLFVYINDVESIDANSVMSVLFIIILIVEIPVIVVKSYLAYNNRIVKMRPKSLYPIENVDDFLHEVVQFRNGNYQYEAIKSQEDIIDCHARGKMIIFTEIPLAEKTLIGLGVFLTTIVIIIVSIVAIIGASDLEFTILFLSITYPVAVGVGGIFIIPNIIKLKRLKRAFFILDPSGIVYRRKWGGVRAYSWKELDLKIYRVQSTLKSFGMSIDLPKSAQFNVILPNGMPLEFKPAEFTHKEYFSVEEITRKLEENPEIPKSYKYALTAKARKGVLGLIALSFMFYFKLGKLDSEEQIQEAYFNAKREIESRKSQKQPEKKPIFRTAERILLDENQIYTFFKENVGKAFTARSLFKRINELGLNEEILSKITFNMLEEVLNNLVKKRKITLERKGSEEFYHY
jgi:hypothetical protein